MAGNCQANIIVVENAKQLQKILRVWDQLPHLKAVVQYMGDLEEKKDNVYNVSIWNSETFFCHYFDNWKEVTNVIFLFDYQNVFIIFMYIGINAIFRHLDLKPVLVHGENENEYYFC